MPTSVASNRAARDAVLARVKKALGKTDDRLLAHNAADGYIAAHTHGPRPAMPADLVAKFMARATDMESTVERIAERKEIPGAVVRLSMRWSCRRSSPRRSRTPASAGLSRRSRPESRGPRHRRRLTIGNDRLGIWHVLRDRRNGNAGRASGADTPTATTLLPDTHVASCAPTA
jgi:L-lactate dehydrogenase complex protein LldG